MEVILLWGPQYKAEGTAIRQGGRARDGAGGQRTGWRDSPFHAEAAVLRDRELDLADEAVR